MVADMTNQLLRVNTRWDKNNIRLYILDDLFIPIKIFFIPGRRKKGAYITIPGAEKGNFLLIEFSPQGFFCIWIGCNRLLIPPGSIHAKCHKRCKQRLCKFSRTWDFFQTEHTVFGCKFNQLSQLCIFFG